MNKTHAIREVLSVLGALHNYTRQDKKHLVSLSQGKLYELYVLATIVSYLGNRGFNIHHVGCNICFKQAPGKLYVNDPHFVVNSPNGQLQLYVDIEFQTLGHISAATQNDLSTLHELDVVLIKDPTDRSNPTYSQILLGVECKSNAVLKKSFVREALGLRRELSYMRRDTVSWLSRLTCTNPVLVPAHPASEFWLAFTDPQGMRYQKSPAVFGVELRHIQP